MTASGHRRQVSLPQLLLSVLPFSHSDFPDNAFLPAFLSLSLLPTRRSPPDGVPVSLLGSSSHDLLQVVRKNIGDITLQTMSSSSSTCLVVACYLISFKYM